MRTITEVVRASLIAAVTLVALSACKPEYPTCETDQDCKESEFCVDRKCQQCRTSDDCQAGFQCSDGRCAAIAGYCTDASQCPQGQVCIANRCQACSDDGECPSGLRCMAGACQKPECATDDDCPQDKDCVKGTCVAVAPTNAGGPPCPLSAIYFAFDDSGLSEEGRATLASNVECLKKADRPVDLIGHADPRGTDEYNLALADKRAQSVKKYLERLGIDSNRLRPLPRGSLDARGTDEQSWARDRRVDLEWQ